MERIINNFVNKEGRIIPDTLSFINLPTGNKRLVIPEETAVTFTDLLVKMLNNQRFMTTRKTYDHILSLIKSPAMIGRITEKIDEQILFKSEALKDFLTEELEKLFP